MATPRVPISKRLVLINSTSQILTRVLYLGVIVWTIQYLVKRVPAEEYALFPLMMALILVIPVLQSLLTGGLSRYVTEAYAKDDLRRVTELTSTVMPVLVIVGVVLVLLGGLAAWKAEFLLQIKPERVSDARFMLMLLAVSAAFSLVLTPYTVGLVVCQRFVLQNLLQLASTVLRILLLVVLLLGVGPQVKWVVLAQVAGNVSLVAAKSVVSRRLIPSLRLSRSHLNWSIARELYGYNGWNSLMGVSLLIRDSADPFILKWFAGPLAVGAFDLGALVDRELRRMSSFASDPLQPVLTAMHAENRQDRLRSAFLRGGRIGMWGVLAPACLLVVFREDLYRLYLGSRFDEYRACITVLALLLAVYVTFYPRWMLHKIAAARGCLREVAVATVLMQLTNLVVTLILIWGLGMGAVGSALASFSVCTCYNLAVFYPMSLRQLDLPLSKFAKETILPGLGPAVAAMLAGGLLKLIWPTPLIGQLGAMIGVGAVVYGSVLLLFCLSPVDRRDLQQIRNRFMRFLQSSSAR